MKPAYPELDAALRATRLVCIIRRQAPCDLPPIVAACLEGGARLIEITLYTPGCLDALRTCAPATPSGAFLGVGTVCTVAEAEAAAAAGARFVVSPIFNPELIAAARRLGLASFPGVATPTEAWQAAQAGADYLKLFPAGSPETVRTLRGPFPQLPFVAVGGVSTQNALDYLRAGCVAVGVGGALYSDPATPLAAIASGTRELLAACAR